MDWSGVSTLVFKNSSSCTSVDGCKGGSDVVETSFQTKGSRFYDQRLCFMCWIPNFTSPTSSYFGSTKRMSQRMLFSVTIPCYLS